MKLEILDHKKNPLMSREESTIIIEHPGKATPCRHDVLSEVAKKLGSKEDLVIIDKIFTNTGKAASKARIFTYKKNEDVPKEKLEKMQRRMKKKKEGKKPEAKPVEKKPKEDESKEKPEEKKSEKSENK